MKICLFTFYLFYFLFDFLYIIYCISNCLTASPATVPGFEDLVVI